MCDGGKFTSNPFLYLLKLTKVDIELTIVEMALLHWITNLLEFLQPLGVVLLGCSLACIIEPFYDLIYLL